MSKAASRRELVAGEDARGRERWARMHTSKAELTAASAFWVKPVIG